MTVREYMNIGYIRSNCLSKVAACVDHLPKTQLSISRSRTEKTKFNSDYRWLQSNLLGKVDFKIDWNIWKDKTPFENVVKQIAIFKNKYHFEDFVINKIEVGIDDSFLVNLINNYLSKDETFDSDTRFYVTFSNKPVAYDVINGWDAKVVRDINLNAIVNLKFKRGVLDLTKIESEHKKSNPKKIENIISVLNEGDVIDQILSNLKTDRWFKFPEVQQYYVNKHHPYPGAIRIYERKSGYSKWSFIKEQEVVKNV